MKKEEKIQEVYINLLGFDAYQLNKDLINFTDATIKVSVNMKLPNKAFGFSIVCAYSDYALFIPTQLKGIETNNGWQKIESEADLPSEKGFYQCVKDNGLILGLYFSSDKEWRYGEQDQTKQVTHWCKLNDKPIY